MSIYTRVHYVYCTLHHQSTCTLLTCLSIYTHVGTHHVNWPVAEYSISTYCICRDAHICARLVTSGARSAARRTLNPGHSPWTQAVDTARGHSPWTQPVNTTLDTARGHSPGRSPGTQPPWTQPVDTTRDTARGHSPWTQTVDTARAVTTLSNVHISRARREKISMTRTGCQLQAELYNTCRLSYGLQLVSCRLSYPDTCQAELQLQLASLQA